MSTHEPTIIYCSNPSIGNTVATALSDVSERVVVIDGIADVYAITARRFGKNFPIDLWLDPTPEL